MTRVDAPITLAVLLGLGACVSADGPGDDGPGAPARSTIGGAAAALASPLAVDSYVVPLPPGFVDLAGLERFALGAATVTRTADALVVEFTLPAGLLGFEAPVRLEGPATGATVAVQGPMAEGTCAVGPALRCDLRYVPAVYGGVDLDGVARYWQARGDARVDQRLIVSSLFDADPLGVLELTVE